MKMTRKLIAITLLLLVLVVGISGCILEDKVSNEKEATDATIQATESLNEISGSLDEVDESLG